MARKAGQIIGRGQNTWLVRIFQGRDPQTGTRKYLNQTIHGPFREAQRFLNLKLQQRDLSRTPRAAAWAFDDTKRKRSRRVAKLQNFVLDALRTLREEQGACGEGNCCAAAELIFVNESGMPLRQQVVKREFRRLLSQAGIRPVRLYDLRHTAATLGVAAGVSVKVISDQLGHASISFTLERYSHILPSIQDEAAEKVEKLLVA